MSKDYDFWRNIEIEYYKNKQRLEYYEKKIADTPKGTIEVKNDKYYYLKYRQDGKIVSKYLGCEKQKIGSLIKQIENRKQYAEKIKEAKNNLKYLEKCLPRIRELREKPYISSRHIRIVINKPENYFLTYFIIEGKQYEVKKELPSIAIPKEAILSDATLPDVALLDTCLWMGESFRKNKIRKIMRERVLSKW